MRKNMGILIVDDDFSMTKTIIDILKVKGYEVEKAHSGVEALDMVKKRPYDCVLTDIRMPEMSGVELHREITAIRPELPVVLMTAFTVDSLVNEALQKGAIAVLPKPLDFNLLLSFFDSLSKDFSIIIVDDDPRFCQTTGDILRAKGFEVIQVTDPHDWQEAIKANGHIVLLDMKLNGISGLEILKKLKKKNPHQPVILVTGHGEEMSSEIETALEISAHTCLYKPFQMDELLKVFREIKHLELGRALGRSIGK